MYNIIEVKEQYEIEQLGTKQKFWVYINNKKYLFKIGRENTRENLAEKVIYEIGKLIDLKVIKYEFAKYQNKLGVLSPLFLKEDERLVHGNELLAKVIKNYPKEQFFKVRDYKLTTVLGLIGILSEKYNKNFLDDFISYIIFDCLVANQDRHHENWGFVVSSLKKDLKLSPSYDHAAGLGCKVNIDEIQNRLTTKDKGYSVEKFCQKAKTPFYHGKKRLSTTGAVRLCAKFNKKAVLKNIEKINELLDFSKVDDIFNKIPKEFYNHPMELEFSKKILEINKNRLNDLLKEFK
jgi:hypothetical protein